MEKKKKKATRYFSSKSWYIQDQQRMAILGSATMESHMQVPSWVGKEDTLHKGQGHWECPIKQSPGFFIGWVLARKDVSFFFLLGSLILIGWESTAFWQKALLNWGFYLFIFSQNKTKIIPLVAVNILVEKGQK